MGYRIVGVEVLNRSKLEPQEVVVCVECLKLGLLRVFSYCSWGGVDIVTEKGEAEADWSEII